MNNTNSTEPIFDTFLNIPESEVSTWLTQNANLVNPTLVEKGKRQAERVGYGGDLDAALSVLDKTEAIAKHLALSLALVYRGRANVLQYHERYEDSLIYSGKAATLYQHYGTEYDVALARTVEVTVFSALERFEEAIELAQWIRPFFIKADFTLGLARLAGALGQAYARAWQLEKALPEYQHARELYLQLEMPLDAAWMLHNMGVLSNRMDQLETAQQYYTQSYPEFVTADDIVMMVKTQFNLAQICQRQGNFEEALLHLTQARSDLTRLPNSPDAGYVDLFEARVRQALNQYSQAEELFQQALTRFQELDRHLEAADTLVGLGHLLTSGKTPEKLTQGLSCLERAEAHLQHLNVPLFKAWVQLEQAELLLRLERIDEAIQQAKTAEKIFTTAGLHLRQAQTIALLADCYWRKRPTEAQQLYQMALVKIGEEVPIIAARCWRGLGRLAVERSDTNLAEQAYNQALTLLDTMRRSLHSHNYQAGFFEDKQALTDELLAALHIQIGHERQVLEWVERFKAGALIDLLIGQPPDSNLDEELRTLLLERDQLSAKLDEQLSGLMTGNSSQLANSPQRGPAMIAHDTYQTQALSITRRQLQTVDEQIARRQNPANAWRDGAIIDSSQVHQLLDGGTILVSYYTAQGNLYALTATNIEGDVHIHPLHIELSKVEAQWEQTYRLMMRAGTPLPMIQLRLSDLWQKLITPFEGRLRNYERLLILPYRSLFSLPFGGLYDNHNKKYLVEQWAVQVAPSATIWDWCRKRPKASSQSLLVGYPGQPEQPGYLPNVEQEITDLANLLPNASRLFGEAVTLNNVLTQMPGKTFIHLAGHAFYNQSLPLESGMPLAGGRWLRASDLYSRYGHLTGSTVVLSGCETGKVRPTGGDVLGLISAFLYAGAAGVVAGLWKVDDGATAILMTTFYRELTKGTKTAEALRHAQLHLLHSNAYRAPYFWAPFVLNGDSRLL